jgi:hypothetical protein
MVEEISVTSLKNSGHNSWGEFLINIEQSSSDSKGVLYYVLNDQHELKDVHLPISTHILEEMALEEVKLLLILLNVKSFEELTNKIQESNKHYDKIYSFDVIVRKENDEIVVKRISLKTKLIDRLASIEKHGIAFPTYYEEKKGKK